MCGTLLFDDVQKCTKCGEVFVKEEGEKFAGDGAEAPAEPEEEPVDEKTEEKETSGSQEDG